MEKIGAALFLNVMYNVDLFRSDLPSRETLKNDNSA